MAEMRVQRKYYDCIYYLPVCVEAKRAKQRFDERWLYSDSDSITGNLSHFLDREARDLPEGM